MTKLQESFVKRIGWALTAALTLTLPGLAWAQNAIRSIQSSQQSGVEVVRIEFDQALSAIPNWLSRCKTRRESRSICQACAEWIGSSSCRHQSRQSAICGSCPIR